MVCSFWPRQVGKASPIPCSASPIPATLPWPKIAQTPSMKRSPSSVLCTAQPAHHRLRRGQPYRLGHAVLLRLRPRRIPDPAEPRDSARAISSTASASLMAPASQARATSPKIVRPTAKPLTRSNRAATSKLAASSASGASSPSTTMPRVWLSCALDRGDGVAPGRPRSASVRASTSRGRCRRRRTAGSAWRWCRHRPGRPWTE